MALRSVSDPSQPYAEPYMPGRGIARSLIASLSVLSLACASNTVNSTTPAPAAAQGAAAKPGGD